MTSTFVFMREARLMGCKVDDFFFFFLESFLYPHHRAI